MTDYVYPPATLIFQNATGGLETLELHPRELYQGTSAYTQAYRYGHDNKYFLIAHADATYSSTYTWNVAQQKCRKAEGWRLPSLNDLRQLFKFYEWDTKPYLHPATAAYKAAFSHGKSYTYAATPGTGQFGYNGDNVLYSDGSSQNIAFGYDTYYWTSDVNPEMVMTEVCCVLIVLLMYTSTSMAKPTATGCVVSRIGINMKGTIYEYEKLNRLLTGAVLLWLASCSEGMLDEAAQSGIQMPEDNGTAERRTVELQIQNKLQVSESSATRTDASIATTDENEITAMDIYVFGSETEHGIYTFQERLTYRAGQEETAPKGATPFILVTNGTDNKLSTARLSLKKGLYVKLYCVANSPELYVLDEQEKNMCQLCSNPW